MAADKTGNLFVADYNQGVIYKYKSDGTRTTLTTGLYHPVGMACDTVGNLWVADNNAGNLHQGAIYQFNTNGSRATFALLAPTDRPADLALDNMNGLYVADLNGDVYRYDLGVLYRNPRTKFGSVPNSAKSLAWDTSGNLYVLDAGDINGNGNMIYKFTTEAVRTVFASAQSLGETFEVLAIQPPVCCQ